MSSLNPQAYAITHQHINHLAILVAGIVQWVLGAVWYSALFGKPWRELVGMKKPPTGASAIIGMVTSFIGGLVMSFVLAHVMQWAFADNFPWGAFIGFLCWLGFIAPILVAQALYEKRSFKLLAINLGYWVVALMMTGGLLAQWQ